MKKWILLFSVLVAGLGNVQDKVGGACEGCEAIHESPVLFKDLKMFVRLPDFTETSANRIGINGTVLTKDGKPAKDVVIYLYHTNPTGVYPKKGDEAGWGKRHGYLRAWMKTDAKGEYKFVTLRPGAYPGRAEPAHIHMTIKEPDKNEYYIDEILFDDDPLLTTGRREKLENRGGSGIVKLINVGSGMFKGQRDIYLGSNIPNYPER